MTVVDPTLVALQRKAEETSPPVLPVNLGRTGSVTVVDGPKVRFVLTSEVAYHELDCDWTAIIGLYHSIRDLLGDAINAAEEAQKLELGQLREQRDQLLRQVAERDATIAALEGP